MLSSLIILIKAIQVIISLAIIYIGYTIDKKILCVMGVALVVLSIF